LHQGFPLPQLAEIESWIEMAIAPLKADNAAPTGDHAIITLAAQLGRNLVFVITIGLGFAALAAYLTNGFGLLGSPKASAPEQPWLLHSGDKIVVPEGSSLRDRLTVAPAQSEPVNTKLVLPGVVEADPARTASVLTPLSGRLVELKVSLGDRVAKDQIVAVIDSPDLAQAFDDDEKAKAVLEMTEKNLKRQQSLSKTHAAISISAGSPAALTVTEVSSKPPTYSFASIDPRFGWIILDTSHFCSRHPSLIRTILRASASMRLSGRSSALASKSSRRTGWRTQRSQ
jgi:hypothetical protein